MSGFIPDPYFEINDAIKSIEERLSALESKLGTDRLKQAEEAVDRIGQAFDEQELDFDRLWSVIVNITHDIRSCCNSICSGNCYRCEYSIDEIQKKYRTQIIEAVNGENR